MPRILENKYYVDEIYDVAIINPTLMVSREGLWKLFDVGVIDGLLHAIAEVVIETAQFALAKLYDRSSLARLSDPAGLLRDGRRAVTKAVLSPVRFLFTGETGGIGSNDDAAAWYSSTRALAPELVRAGRDPPPQLAPA